MVEGSERPLLSICIATRNRASLLQQTLDSFIHQISVGVELVIVDGASSDGTPAMLAAYADSYPFVRYVRKEVNGGVDRDYDETVALAQGKYCWLMSDDDVPVDGALDHVLSRLGDEPSLLILNSEVRDLGLVDLLDSNRLDRNVDRVYPPEDFDALFRETSAYLGYIGAVVIARELWLARERAAYFGSCFIHVGVIFQAPLPRHAVLCAKPLVSVRFGNTQWRPREFEIRMFLWTDLVWSLPAISDRLRSVIYPRRPWQSPKSLFFYRAKGTFGLVEYRKFIPHRTRSIFYRTQALCIAVFPGPIANLIGLVVCRLPYRDANLHLLDMRASRFYLRNWMANLRHGATRLSGRSGS